MNTITNIAGIKFNTPVITASGTFGYGGEIRDLLDISKIGGIITKTITLKPKQGNSSPRLAEVTSGLLNSIGLQNVGIDRFIKEKWPGLIKLPTTIVVSIAGQDMDEYVQLVKILNSLPGLKGIELNLSCPNLQKQIICHDIELVKRIVNKTSKVSKLPIIVKLSPLVTNLSHLAVVAKDAGAKALSLVNTFPGMAIDINTWKPKLSTVTGGMSGPAIKPLALRCVWEVYKNTRMPIIGGGGIMTGADAIEFLLAGASAVSIGTANFIDPRASVEITNDIVKYLENKKLKSLTEIIGKVKVNNGN